MKVLRYIILIICFTSCEDVIDVDLDESPPQLVVEASINWIQGTSGHQQNINLSLTTPFFETETTPVTDAEVSITNTEGTIFEFIQNETLGSYETSSFQPELDMEYTLTIIYKGEIYSGTTTLEPVIPIDFVDQTQEGGLEGDDFEIKPNYTDPADEQNFYFYSFESDVIVFPTLQVYEDEFTDGSQVFAYYSEEDLEAGDTVTIRTFGITERFYDFMFILLTQTNQMVGGPFETQPATLRGNVVNTTNQDNFPLGYFRASEVDEVVYVIEDN